MTQLFGSGSPGVGSEKRNFPNLSLSSKKQSGDSSHFPTRLKNFFRINSNSHGNNGGSNSGSGGNNTSKSGTSATSKPENKSSLRQSRFLPGITRNRSTTVASEGNPLDDGVSPIATANPYFAHQGYPALRHRNDDSPSHSPPDTPELQIDGVAPEEQTAASGKEELARRLRRVASAPNAQGLFASSKSDGRPKSAERGGIESPLGKENVSIDKSDPQSLAIPKPDASGKLPTPGQVRTGAGFRRTYSSNSIKVRNVEVGPGSFDKIKMIGKGDVGKVYLVREKKSSRLYAMKGTSWNVFNQRYCYVANCGLFSFEQAGDDQAEQDQACVGRTRDSSHE